MEATILTYIFIPYIILLVFKKIDFIFYSLIFFAPFTSFSILNVNGGSSSILVAQVIFLVLFIKTIYYILRKDIVLNIRFNKWILSFIIICGLSLFLIPYKEAYTVLTPDNVYGKVKFSFQNITQYAYLLLSYLVYIITYLLYKNNKIKISTSMKVITSSFLMIIILGFLQRVIPINIYNSIFRNTVYINNQIMDGVVRISSANTEASMLVMFITPFSCAYLYSYYKTKELWYLILGVLGTIIGLICKSSSFYIGVGTFILIILFLNIINGKNSVVKSISIFKKKLYLNIKDRNKSKTTLELKRVIQIAIVVIVILIIAIVIGHNIFIQIQRLLYKITGNGESGSMRITAIVNQFNVFKENILLGVGFGTSRSYDLITTWLSQVGIIGVGLYFIFILEKVRILYKINSIKSIASIIIIIGINMILMISVPEFSFIYIWIYYGITEYIIDEFNSKDQIVDKY